MLDFAIAYLRWVFHLFQKGAVEQTLKKHNLLSVAIHTK
jgi:hypothetical protein